MPWSIHKKFFFVFFASLVISIGLSGLVLSQLHRVASSILHVERTHQFLEGLEGVITSIEDVEQEERGYVMSGNDYFLNGFNATVPLIAHEILELQGIARNTRQSDELNNLDELVRTRISSVADLISLRQERGFDAALDRLVKGGQTAPMADVKRFIKQMQSEVRSTLREREAKEDDNLRIVSSITLLGIAFGLAAAAAAGYLLYADLREKERARVELKEAYEASERQVVERTSRLAELNETLVNEISEKNIIQGRLESIIRDLENFTSIISHDVQAPIRRILVFCDFLAHDAGHALQPKQREYLRRIHESASRMTDLVENLAQYSRTAENNMLVDSVEVGAVVEQVLADLEVEVAERKPDIRIHDLPRVKGNRTLMRQVLQNLISNALKYSGEKPPAIDISAEKKDEEWVISVADDGMGIDPKDHHRIFEMYHRTTDSKHLPGQGVGLAVCKRIVERHGGRIWVESDHGRGSVFRFTIPAR